MDFWFSAFQEYEPEEEEGTFFKQLGNFLMDQTRYLQVRGKSINLCILFLFQDLRLNVSSENLWDALDQGTFSVVVGVLTKSINSKQP